ncbi:MAG: M20 family metallopeptidase [Eubacteriaceae bacterium]|nr:M20 family metallopeptidase [Eubacteriaceae bacterium]
MNVSEINQLIKKASERSTELRRVLHMNPELSCQEKNTADMIAAELDRLGISYRKNVFGYGICAVIEGKDKSRSIGIRADMDALPMDELNDLPYKSQIPGVMHACGHDVHVATLLGSASVLQELSDYLPVSVTLFFQPSEETIGGAEGMIKAGCMDNPKVEATIGLHINAFYDYDKIIVVPGTMNAATCEFRVKVIGKSCHGAHPDTGIDPLLPACNMVTAIQSILTRRMAPYESNLITIGKFHSGTKENIIPDFSEFSGTIRVLDMDNRDKIKSEIKRLCEGIAEGYGAHCQIEFNDGYPTLVNDDRLLEIITSNYREKFGDDKVIINPTPSLGADDFAYFCHASRGLYIDVGAKSPSDEPMSLHSSDLVVDERCITTGIQAEVYSVLKLMGVE